MKRVVTATEARIRFGELIRRVVENRESVIVERSGKPQAVVLSVSEYERLLEGQQDQNEWKSLVASARDQIRAELGNRKLMPPEEVIAEMREERDEQLIGLR
ncbi:MAG: type II toxin-antitoxin system Phd/YefM family antitoxin [Deltaproteobacteria bacterium]|nr:type II toxin-antitoxin system Phd/YefM family antitoxin [Deltaproteobacteria bacterium]